MSIYLWKTFLIELLKYNLKVFSDIKGTGKIYTDNFKKISVEVYNKKDIVITMQA